MLEDLVIMGHPDAGRWLDEWTWLLPGKHRVVLLTKMGDAFLVDAEGKVVFLDTLEGAVLPAAPSLDAFESLLQAGTIDLDWFNPDMVALLDGRGERLAPGQCFSYKVPPALGGPLDSSNVGVTSLAVHFSMAGQLHRQIRQMRPGTRITGFGLQEP